MEHAGDGWQTEGRPANLRKGSGPTTGSCASTVLKGTVVLKLYTNVACFDVINIKLTSICTFDVLYTNICIIHVSLQLQVHLARLKH